MANTYDDMYDYVDHFFVGTPTSRGQFLHYSFSERILRQIRTLEQKCKICGNGKIRLMTFHLFSPEENGHCHDSTLSLRFINSIGNAVLMCKRCHCRLGEILQFVMNKSNAQLQKQLLKCYFCGNLVMKCSTYKNTNYSCSVMYCVKCYDNVNQVLDYMKSVSNMLNTTFQK